jgi:predicted ATPase
LKEAFDAVIDGEAKAVCIHGPSGIGKSALVRRVLREFATRPGVVLRSLLRKRIRAAQGARTV